jgi:hypothetical protein
MAINQTAKISIVHNAGGEVTPSGELTWTKGHPVAFRVTPDVGFKVESVDLMGYNCWEGRPVIYISYLRCDTEIVVTFAPK